MWCIFIKKLEHNQSRRCWSPDYDEDEKVDWDDGIEDDVLVGEDEDLIETNDSNGTNEMVKNFERKVCCMLWKT